MPLTPSLRWQFMPWPVEQDGWGADWDRLRAKQVDVRRGDGQPGSVEQTLPAGLLNAWLRQLARKNLMLAVGTSASGVEAMAVLCADSATSWSLPEPPLAATQVWTSTSPNALDDLLAALPTGVQRLIVPSLPAGAHLPTLARPDSVVRSWAGRVHRLHWAGPFDDFERSCPAPLRWAWRRERQLALPALPGEWEVATEPEVPGHLMWLCESSAAPAVFQRHRWVVSGQVWASLLLRQDGPRIDFLELTVQPGAPGGVGQQLLRATLRRLHEDPTIREVVWAEGLAAQAQAWGIAAQPRVRVELLRDGRSLHASVAPALASTAALGTVQRYSRVADLPPAALRLMRRAEARNVEFGPDWFARLERQVFRDDPGLCYLVMSSSSGVQAVLPLRVERRVFGDRGLALGNFYTSLYTPALSPGLTPPDLAPLVAALREPGHRMAQLRLAPLDLADEPTLLWTSALQQAGWRLLHYFAFGNWVLPVGGRDWTRYLADRKGGLRSTLKRMGRRFEEAGGTMEVVCDAGARLEPALQAYQAVYRSSWKAAEPYPQFVPELVRDAARRGWLRLGVAWIGAQPAAAQIWLVHQGRGAIFKVGYDENYRAMSVATLLTGHLMRHLIEKDRVTEVDFLMGDDGYKADWMECRRERWGLLAYDPRHPAGWAAWRAETLRRWARPWIGRLSQRWKALRMHPARTTP